jgi:hypothetical protein
MMSLSLPPVVPILLAIAPPWIGEWIRRPISLEARESLRQSAMDMNRAAIPIVRRFPFWCVVQSHADGIPYAKVLGIRLDDSGATLVCIDREFADAPVHIRAEQTGLVIVGFRYDLDHRGMAALCPS